MFASDEQLELLQLSRTWYIDGTFKLCRHPFTQLLTLNAFVKNDDHVKRNARDIEMPNNNIGFSYTIL